MYLIQTDSLTVVVSLGLLDWSFGFGAMHEVSGLGDAWSFRLQHGSPYYNPMKL